MTDLDPRDPATPAVPPSAEDAARAGSRIADLARDFDADPTTGAVDDPGLDLPLGSEWHPDEDLAAAGLEGLADHERVKLFADQSAENEMLDGMTVSEFELDDPR